jgi:E3 ubiquitin-protein ligase RFWD2
MNGIDPAIASASNDLAQQDGFNGSKSVSKHKWPHTSLSARRKKVYQHFDDLEQCYFNLRQKEFTTGW